MFAPPQSLQGGCSGGEEQARQGTGLPLLKPEQLYFPLTYLVWLWYDFPSLDLMISEVPANSEICDSSSWIVPSSS